MIDVFLWHAGVSQNCKIDTAPRGMNGKYLEPFGKTWGTKRNMHGKRRWYMRLNCKEISTKPAKRKYNKDTEVQVQSGTRWADFPEDRNSAMAAGSGKAARHLAAILLNSSTHVKSPPPT